MVRGEREDRCAVRGAALLLLGLALPHAARADTPEPPAPSASASASASASSSAAPKSWGGPAPPPRDGELDPLEEPLEPGQKRARRDYDGRDDVADAGEVALWIPRVLFFPFYVVTEYFIRAPLGALLVAAERYDIIADLLAPSTIGVIPTAFIDFGFRPSAGAYFFWNNFLAEGNDFRAHLSFGGIQFWKGGLADRIPFVPPIGIERSKSYFQMEANFLTRGDLLFWGVGPDTKDEGQATYGIFTVGGGGRFHVEPWRGRIFEAWLTARYTSTDEGACRGQQSIVTEDYVARLCNPPTIRRQILDGVYPLPPHYGRPYATLKNGVRVVLDSREPRPAPGTGAAVDVSVEQVSEFDQPKTGGWLNWGGVAAGFVDLTGTQRVLSLTLGARFQDRLREETVIPFTELVGAKHIEDVPDLDLMRGFQPGRLLGSSAVVATLEYRWPIWAFIDGTLQAAVGNAFSRPHLEDFDPELLRFSFVGGVRSPNHRDHSFNFLVGFGTNTFREGFQASAFRLVIGGTTGF